MSAAERLRRSPSPAVTESGLYVGALRHRRHRPTSHAFSYPVFMPYLVLDEIDEVLARSRWWGRSPLSVVRFRRRDHLDGSDRPLDEAVRDLVEERTGTRPTGRIGMLSHLRTAGFNFNPLSAYWCWSPDGSGVEAIVLEVTNTPWGERIVHVLEVDEPGAGPWRARFAKAMHVSPFLPMGLEYQLTASGPEDRLHLRFDVLSGDEVVFDADLVLFRRPADAASMARVLLRHPLEPLRGWLRIHVQAFRLWRKRTPVHRNPRSHR